MGEILHDYYYELPNGLTDKPNVVTIKVGPYNKPLVKLGTFANWEYLINTEDKIHVLRTQSKIDIFDTAMSKKFKRIVSVQAVGFGQIYESLLRAFQEKINPSHNYIRIADNKTGMAYLYNFKTISINNILFAVAKDIFNLQHEFVKLYSTQQGFVIVVGADHKIIFSSLKTAVPSSAVMYFATKRKV